MASDRLPVRRALLSVSDKTGVLELARALAAMQVELLSTGGTAKALRDAGIPVRDVSEVTGFPEIMDGRVKTLHPSIHGGLLGRSGIDDAVMAEHGIHPIDLLVVNLYPFAATVAKPDCSYEDAIENIDIGGPAMLRAAAKNHARVSVVVDPAQYAGLLEALQAGGTTLAQRRGFAAKAYAHTSAYDGQVTQWLSARAENPDQPETWPHTFNLSLELASSLRYGENPHQRGALYVEKNAGSGIVATARFVQGKELSYNNLADADAALECVKAFDAPACVIVKHANPCGVAVAADLLTAYDRAYAVDPTSAFGGIIAFNRPLDAATVAEILKRQFVEVVLAPSIAADALPLFEKKPNVRVLSVRRTWRRARRPGIQTHRRWPAGAGRRQRCADRHGSEGGQPTRADRDPDGGSSVRLESGDVRQVERHRLRTRPADGRHRRRPDEPRGLGEDRRPQGRGSGTDGAGIGHGQRCLLPVSRRHRRRCHGRHRRRHPAGRFDARRGSHRRRGRTRHGHGLHQPSSFQALSQ